MERTLLIGGVIHFQEARACASVGGVRRAARELQPLQQGRAPCGAGAVAHHIKLAGLCPFRAVHILAVLRMVTGTLTNTQFFWQFC